MPSGNPRCGTCNLDLGSIQLTPLDTAYPVGVHNTAWPTSILASIQLAMMYSPLPSVIQSNGVASYRVPGSNLQVPRLGLLDSVTKTCVICMGNLLVNVILCQRLLHTHVYPVYTLCLSDVTLLLGPPRTYTASDKEVGGEGMGTRLS